MTRTDHLTFNPIQPIIYVPQEQKDKKNQPVCRLKSLPTLVFSIGKTETITCDSITPYRGITRLLRESRSMNYIAFYNPIKS